MRKKLLWRAGEEILIKQWANDMRLKSKKHETKKKCNQNKICYFFLYLVF
jgi:hypothetical protein